MIHQSSITIILHNRLQLNLCAANNTLLFSAHGWLGALLTRVGLAHAPGSQLVWAAGLEGLRSTPRPSSARNRRRVLTAAGRACESEQKHTSFLDLSFELHAISLASFYWPTG